MAEPKPPPENPADEPEFEDIVAALLKVDPKGITGQRAAKKPDDDADPEDD